MSTVETSAATRIENDPTEVWEGERLPRLTASEFKRKKSAASGEVDIKLSLADILFGDSVLENLEDGQTVVVKPINFKGLGTMEKEYGSLQDIPGEDKLRGSIRELVKMLTILVNQDLKTKDEKSEDDVGRVINAENMESVIRAVVSAIRPTLASATRRPGAIASLPTGPG